MLFSGTDGNYFKLERCNFTGNVGLGSNSDYGAAFMVSLLTPFRERVTIPRHEVIDWYVIFPQPDEYFCYLCLQMSQFVSQQHWPKWDHQHWLCTNKVYGT